MKERHGACEFAKFVDWKLLITRLKDTREQQFPGHRLSLGWMFHFIIKYRIYPLLRFWFKTYPIFLTVFLFELQQFKLFLSWSIVDSQYEQDFKNYKFVYNSFNPFVILKIVWNIFMLPFSCFKGSCCFNVVVHCLKCQNIITLYLVQIMIKYNLY